MVGAVCMECFLARWYAALPFLMMIQFLSINLPPAEVFALLAFVAFVGGVLRGFSGFGAGLLIAPVFSFFISPADIVILIVVLNLCTTLQFLPDAFKKVNWMLVMKLFLPSLVGIPLGVALIHVFDPQVMRKIIGFLVTLSAALMLYGWHYDGRRGLVQDSLVGFGGGLLTAIGGIGGPPVILYLLSDRKLPIDVFRAVCFVLFFLIQILALIQISFGPGLNKTQGALILSLFPLYILAHWVGDQVYRRTAGKYDLAVKRVSLIALLAIGVLACIL